ncbi:protein aveugle-like [Ceratitis capitata]|uniref:protein aveugle-like n=1 Tax=Ceratitis capitata TaxID=7213 RepID=UPI00061890AD|nr:protein aveugle-like [Ceratitis capitata]
MVEETVQKSRLRVKIALPKSVFLFSVTESYMRHCGEYPQYLELFSKHEITDSALLRVNDYSLQRMDISHSGDHEAIFGKILKQGHKTDIMEIRDMER